MSCHQLILFFFLTMTSSLFAQHNVVQNLRGKALTVSVYSYCLKYYEQSDDCSFMSQNLSDIFDLNYVSKRELVGYQTLQFFGRSLQITSYLQYILSTVQNKEFNLWNETYNYFKQDKNFAIKVLGVLFQDGLYSDRVSSVLQNEGQKTLMKALASKNIVPSKLYPYLNQKNFTHQPYHFYTIAYMANLLKKNGRSEHQAFWIAFIINYIYESVSTQDLGYFYLLTSPSDFENIFSAKEIYMGYEGASWAMERDNYIPFENFLEILQSGQVKQFSSF